MRRVIVVASLLASLTSVNAQASPIIDQSCCPNADATAGFSQLTRVQTFTVGMGGVMTGIDVGLLSQGPTLPTFELFAGAFSAGQLVSSFGSPLATLAVANTGVAVPGGCAATYFFSRLGAGVPVVPGLQFSSVHRPTSSGGSWMNDIPGPYLGGIALTTLFSGGGVTDSLSADLAGPGQPVDFAFRTYVDAAGVP